MYPLSNVCMLWSLLNTKTSLSEFTFSELFLGGCGWGVNSDIKAESRCIFVPFTIIWIESIVGECNKVSYMSVVLTCLPFLQLIEKNTYVFSDMWYLRSWASCHWSQAPSSMHPWSHEVHLAGKLPCAYPILPAKRPMMLQCLYAWGSDLHN